MHQNQTVIGSAVSSVKSFVIILVPGRHLFASKGPCQREVRRRCVPDWLNVSVTTSAQKNIKTLTGPVVNMKSRD